MKKLLGVQIDDELNFIEPVSSLCKKDSQKLNAVSSMTFDQRRLTLNSFITSFLLLSDIP